MLVLNGPITLRVIGSGAHSLHPKQVAQLLDHLTGEGQVIVHHKVQWSTKNIERMMVQHMCHSLSSCVFSHKSHSMLGEVICDNEHIYYFRLLLQFLTITTDLEFSEIQM